MASQLNGDEQDPFKLGSVNFYDAIPDDEGTGETQEEDPVES